MANDQRIQKIKEEQINQLMRSLKRVVQVELLLNLKIAKKKALSHHNKLMKEASVKRRSLLWLVNLFQQQI